MKVYTFIICRSGRGLLKPILWRMNSKATQIRKWRVMIASKKMPVCIFAFLKLKKLSSKNSPVLQYRCIPHDPPLCSGGRGTSKTHRTETMQDARRPLQQLQNYFITAIIPPSASYSKIPHVKTVGSWNWPEVVIAFKRFSSVSHLGIKLLTEICCIANKCRDSLLQKDILFISRYNLTKNPYSCSQLRFRSLQCCLDWRSKG